MIAQNNCEANVPCEAKSLVCINNNATAIKN